MSEWSVLVTSHLDADAAAISSDEVDAVLDLLPGEDKWIQYPPASGRGHAFETRFWWDTMSAVDAAAGAAEAIEAYQAAITAAGVQGVHIAFVHVTSAEERLTEGPIGLDRRRSMDDMSRDWHVMQRSIATQRSSAHVFDAEMLRQLLSALGRESSGHARDGMVEVRFWVSAGDAVEASALGSALFQAAMRSVGRGDWWTVRDHATSVAEAVRLAYLGVEPRVAVMDPSTLPVTINPGPS